MNSLKIIKIVTAAFLFSVLLTSYGEAARVYLDITSADFRKIPFAVPYFVDKNRK